jgi:hypothetical protein
MTMKTLSMALVASMVWLPWPTAVPAAEGTAIEPVEHWADVFSGSAVKFHYTVRTTQALAGRLSWSLSVGRRTVEQGQMPLVAGAERAIEVTVALKIPDVKEGVILESQLNLAAFATGDPEPVAEHVKTVWIFPRDPFADRSQWLKELKITLFDPAGATVDVLEKAHVPYTLTKNTAALDELVDGLLLIGEGTAWKDYRSLGEAMMKAAARGVPVLCLAPGEGRLYLPGAAAGAEMPPPARVAFRREDVIRELDKRLDAAAWPPTGSISASRLTITSDRDQVVAEVSQAATAWPWLEVHYPAARGRLLVCGFGIIRQWEATPTPRYLLSEMFLRLTADKRSTPLPHEERNH